MKRDSLSRRRFLGAASTVAAFTVAPRHVLGRGAPAPSDKLNIAGVGIGGRGFNDLRAVASENIVALCDVDQRYAAPVFKNWPEAKRHVDFRKMLETQKDIDAVIIATPDHLHAVTTLMAMELGKHVYCEKPLTHSVLRGPQGRRCAAGIEGRDADGQPGSGLGRGPPDPAR